MARTRLRKPEPADDSNALPRRALRTSVARDDDVDDAGDSSTDLANSFSPRSIRRSRAEDGMDGTQDSRADRDNHTGQFLTGNRLPPGRRPGQPNRITTVVKTAILSAGEQIGDPSDHNRGGLTGYLRWLAVTEPSAYASLLRRILPMTIRADSTDWPTRISAYRHTDEWSRAGHRAPAFLT